ncbi:MAG: Alcohol dehydrogenase, zinc-binding protein [Rhodospirillales bacterium]|nr:Alcohol dehydrogenase, zinc-binding protein [Rhodospirillales bacterium]
MRVAAVRPEADRFFAIEDRPEIQPGPGEVRLRMRAASLNYRDLMVAQNRYGATTPGVVPLSDGVGEVIELGAGVTRVAIGDRVSPNFFRDWIEGEPDGAKLASAFGGDIDGVLREELVVPETALVQVPKHLSDEEAASLSCAGLTAWVALFEHGKLMPGETVLIQGTGGVSVFALQFAKLAGARAIVLSSSKDKLERARKLGADHLIDRGATPDWEKEVLKLTGYRGVDHVVEVGGAGTLGRSLQAARIGGHVAVIGVLTGVTGDVPTGAILRKLLRVHGVYVGSRSQYERMNRAIEAAKLRPVVDATYRFDQANDALRALEAAQHFGKIVIKIA